MVGFILYVNGFPWAANRNNLVRTYSLQRPYQGVDKSIRPSFWEVCASSREGLFGFSVRAGDVFAAGVGDSYILGVTFF